MEIRKIRVSNMKAIYEGLLYCAKENRTGFGNDLYKLLDHCMIGLELTNVTSIEAFYLRRFCSSVKIVDKSYSNFDHGDNRELSQMVSGLLDIHDQLIQDNDMNPQMAYDDILPIGSIKYHLVCMFQGFKILTLTGALIQNIFLVDNKLPGFYPGDNAIENKIGEVFYQEFYSYILKESSQFDLVTSFITNKKFYQYAEDRINIADVITPYGSITFFGNDQDNLNRQINQIKESMKDLPYVYEDLIKVTFIIRSSFQSFMYFYLNPNFNILDHDNLKLIFADPFIQVDNMILTKYGARIHSFFDFIASYKSSLLNDTKVNLNKYNYIFNGNQITYSLQFSLNEMNKDIQLTSELSNLSNKISSFHDLIVNLIC